MDKIDNPRLTPLISAEIWDSILANAKILELKIQYLDLDDDVFKFLKYSWALTERERGRRGYWTLFDGSHLTCWNLDTFHPAYNLLKY
jgi:hypothetical protein